MKTCTEGSTGSTQMTKSETAVVSMMRKIMSDPRVAYLVGPGSQTYDELTTAYADFIGAEVEAFRKDIESRMKFEAWPNT